MNFLCLEVSQTAKSRRQFAGGVWCARRSPWLLKFNVLRYMWLLCHDKVRNGHHVFQKHYALALYVNIHLRLKFAALT